MKYYIDRRAIVKVKRSRRLLNPSLNRVLIAGLLSYSLFSYAAAAKALRPWTIEDVVTVPEIKDVVISRDGKWALYVVKSADLRLNRDVSSLHLTLLSTGKTRIIAKSSWIGELHSIPESDDWSILADLGNGVQLYRVHENGDMTADIVNKTPAIIGNKDNSIYLWTASDSPQAFGVLSYRWSPNGSSLWYVLSKPSFSNVGQPLVNGEVVQSFSPYRREAPGILELRVRWHGGKDVLVASRPANDPLAFNYGGKPVWNAASDEVRYTVANAGDRGGSSARTFLRRVGAMESVQVPLSQETGPEDIIGPLGGKLGVRGWGIKREMFEELSDGKVHSYGRVKFQLGAGDPRVPGYWRSMTAGRTILGIRYVESHVRSSLLIMDSLGRFRELDGPGGLTSCDFTPALDHGVCVRQGMTKAPELVRIKVVNGTVTPVLSLSSNHAAITPLRVEPKTWVTAAGRHFTGFVIYPRDYTPGKRYPAILVTHGSDADERFAARDWQWEYPVQLFAERGYVVVAVNDPAPAQDPDLQASYVQWTSSKGNFSPEKLQDQLFLTEVLGFESAVEELVASGLVDNMHVGIAGYSRGSQMVNVTMTNSKLFIAASSGDGNYLDPSTYYTDSYIGNSYDRLFGGSPYTPSALSNYTRLSPTFRADRANGPILLQAANVDQARVEFYQALLAAGKPTQITLYRGKFADTGESHILHIPSNRLMAMRENLNWFDFWLKGQEDSDPVEPGQYERWRAMKAEMPAR